jgi:hypothetical protein
MNWWVLNVIVVGCGFIGMFISLTRLESKIIRYHADATKERNDIGLAIIGLRDRIAALESSVIAAREAIQDIKPLEAPAPKETPRQPQRPRTWSDFIAARSVAEGD